MRLISNLALIGSHEDSREDATIPKRGEKDFEPHATALQSNTLAASRRAMHNALSYQRIHNPNGYTYATYHPESNMAYARNPKGPLFAKMGQVLSASEDPLGNDEERGQRVWLLPEEILYLIERGTTDVRWPATEDDGDGLGLPMSLQGAYAIFIGDDASHGGALTLERYSVYASLKRLGYIVLRAPSWDNAGLPLSSEHYPPPLPRRTWQVGFLDYISIWKSFFGTNAEHDLERQKSGPMSEPGLYRDYDTIYRRLALINFYDPTQKKAPEEPELPQPDPNFRITYHVWKPGSTFKKSSPGPPDFRIAVVNARETSVPTLEQLGALMDTVPYSPPKTDGHSYAKLKNGYKNVILAIVDQGMTSYLRVADAAFGREKIYERRPRGGGGKRGGRGGRGGGRGGRGRGR